MIVKVMMEDQLVVAVILMVHNLMLEEMVIHQQLQYLKVFLVELVRLHPFLVMVTNQQEVAAVRLLLVQTARIRLRQAVQVGLEVLLPMVLLDLRLQVMEPLAQFQIQDIFH